jgi:ribosome maturation factor RimP
MATADRVRPVLAEAVASSQVVLEEVTVTPAGKRRVVRVLIDRDLGEVEVVTAPVAPLTLDEIADVTRVVEAALDSSDVMGQQPYTLEVSSPGVARPLTEPRHYQRNVGRLVTLHGPGGETTGRLVRADRSTVTLDLPPTTASPGRQETFPYGDVDRALVQVEFARPDESKES